MLTELMTTNNVWTRTIEVDPLRAMDSTLSNSLDVNQRLDRSPMTASQTYSPAYTTESILEFLKIMPSKTAAFNDNSSNIMSPSENPKDAGNAIIKKSRRKILFEPTPSGSTVSSNPHVDTKSTHTKKTATSDISKPKKRTVVFISETKPVDNKDKKRTVMIESKQRTVVAEPKTQTTVSDFDKRKIAVEPDVILKKRQPKKITNKHHTNATTTTTTKTDTLNTYNKRHEMTHSSNVPRSEPPKNTVNKLITNQTIRQRSFDTTSHSYTEFDSYRPVNEYLDNYKSSRSSRSFETLTNDMKRKRSPERDLRMKKQRFNNSTAERYVNRKMDRYVTRSPDARYHVDDSTPKTNRKNDTHDHDVHHYSDDDDDIDIGYYSPERDDDMLTGTLDVNSMLSNEELRSLSSESDIEEH